MGEFDLFDTPQKPAHEDFSLFDAPVAPKGSARASDLPLRGMRPAVAPDDVSALDVSPDYTKNSRGGQITTPEGRARRLASADANNPLKDDLIGQAIVGGAMTAPLGVLAAGGMRAIGLPALARTASGAIQGAGMNPEHPLAGAALGAIPGVPSMARGADEALGRAAVARQAAGKSFETEGKIAGALAGHHAVPIVGAVPGAYLGGAAGRLADKAVKSMAARQAEREAGAEAMELLEKAQAPAPSGHKVVDPADVRKIFGDDIAASEPPITAAKSPPLDHPGVIIQPGEFGGATRVTNSPATAANPLRMQILDEHGRDLLSPAATPSLRADVARDAAAYRRAPVEEGGGDVSTPYGAPGGGGPPDVKSVLGDQLANSVRLVDELRAGKITAQQAIAAGLPPGVVARAAR